jgi:predicted transcriptional regulator
MPARLRRAMRHLQYACLTHESDVRFTLVVTGLEALVNSRNHGVSAQFKKRVVLAARDVGINISEEIARDVYNFRSSLSHGQRARGKDIQQQFAASYATIEMLLRRLIRRGIEEQSFSAKFESEASIDAAYPI